MTDNRVEKCFVVNVNLALKTLNSKRSIDCNPILWGRGGGAEGEGGGGWTVESTPLNIREYFKNGLQHGFEIF